MLKGQIIIDHAGRIQKVIYMDGDYIYTQYVDCGMYNVFTTQSTYFKTCIITGSSNDILYNNGVPMVWGDDI